MPGKVNPTQCDAMAMMAAQVMGANVAVSIEGVSGYLEMNVYKLMIIHTIVRSVHRIADSCNAFTDSLLTGVKPNKQRIDRYVHESLMLGQH